MCEINVLSRTTKRFDSEEEFFVETSFPVVHRLGNEVNVIIFSIYYSSHPIQDRTYRGLPTSDKKYQWNCDMAFFGDIQTSNSCMAAIDAASMAPNSYLSTDFPLLDNSPLSGASVGLGIFACVMGLPKFIYTGWVSTLGINSGGGCGRVGPIDGLDLKMEKCSQLGVPFFFPGENECATSTLIRCYKSKDFLVGMPYHREHHIGVSCLNLEDVVLLATVLNFQFKHSQ